jgi:hypothetical protein
MSRPHLLPLAESHSRAELTHCAPRVRGPLLVQHEAREHQLLLVSPAPARRHYHQNHSPPR